MKDSLEDTVDVQRREAMYTLTLLIVVAVATFVMVAYLVCTSRRIITMQREREQMYWERGADETREMFIRYICVRGLLLDECAAVVGRWFIVG